LSDSDKEFSDSDDDDVNGDYDMVFTGQSSSSGGVSSTMKTRVHEKAKGPIGATISGYQKTRERAPDPFEFTIDEVYRRTSYDRKTVSDCIVAMFDMGLRYDDPDVVIAFIKRASELESPRPSFKTGNHKGFDDVLSSESTNSSSKSTTQSHVNSESQETKKTKGNKGKNKSSPQKNTQAQIQADKKAYAPAPAVTLTSAPTTTSSMVPKAYRELNVNTAIPMTSRSSSVPETPPGLISPVSAPGSSQSSSQSGTTATIGQASWSSTSVSASACGGSTPTSTSAKSLQPTERLEMAASHASLSEGLSALLAWASHPSSSSATFFTSKSLEILLCRVLCAGPGIDSGTQLNQIMQLVTKLFSCFIPMGSGPTSEALSGVTEGLVELLREARTAERLGLLKNEMEEGEGISSVSGGSAKAVARRISEGIISVYNCLANAHASSSADTSAKIGEMKARLSHLESHLSSFNGIETHNQGKDKSDSSSLHSLLSRREVALELARTHIQLSEVENESNLRLDPSSEIRRVAALGMQTQVYDHKTHTALLNAVGESPESIMAKEKDAIASRSQVDRLLSSHESRMSPLRNDLQTTTHTLFDLERKKEALKQQLNIVIEQINSTIEYKSTLENALSDCTWQRDHEVSAMSSVSQDLLMVLQRAETSRNIVERIVMVERRLGRVAASIAPNQPSPSEKLSTTGRILALTTYCSSEASCIAILCERITGAKVKLKALTVEAQEFKSLGMEKMTKDLDTTISRLTQNCNDDIDAVKDMLSTMVEVVSLSRDLVVGSDDVKKSIAMATIAAERDGVGIEVPAVLTNIANTTSTSVSSFSSSSSEPKTKKKTTTKKISSPHIGTVTATASASTTAKEKPTATTASTATATATRTGTESDNKIEGNGNGNANVNINNKSAGTGTGTGTGKGSSPSSQDKSPPVHKPAWGGVGIYKR